MPVVDMPAYLTKPCADTEAFVMIQNHMMSRCAWIPLAGLLVVIPYGPQTQNQVRLTKRAIPHSEKEEGFARDEPAGPLSQWRGE